MTTIQATAPSGPPRPFPSHHAFDRYAFPLFTALVWVGVLAGFGGDIARHVNVHERAYPLIVHAHAVVFVSWLVLFTVQVALVRTKRVLIHRRLGIAMLGLAAVMVVIGPATALYVNHARLGTPRSDPSFVAVQLSDMVGFGALVIAAALLRTQAAAHKRLMLLSLIYISDAGFARWLAPVVAPMFSQPFVSQFAAAYLPTTVLILALGGYDLVTRGKLQPAYAIATAGLLALEGLATTLYLSRAFTPFALRLAGG